MPSLLFLHVAPYFCHVYPLHAIVHLLCVPCYSLLSPSKMLSSASAPDKYSEVMDSTVYPN